MNNATNRIIDIFKQINSLSAQAYPSYKEEVDDIINQKITDNHRIECALDGILDWAGNSKDFLVLMKKLCRYYYNINPEPTASYIQTYRELYDSDE